MVSLKARDANRAGLQEIVNRNNVSVRRLHRRAVLDSEATRAVILMGPNARHVDPASLDVGPEQDPEITITVAQRRAAYVACYGSPMPTE
jgi:hypothetical protein